MDILPRNRVLWWDRNPEEEQENAVLMNDDNSLPIRSVRFASDLPGNGGVGSNKRRYELRNRQISPVKYNPGMRYYCKTLELLEDWRSMYTKMMGVPPKFAISDETLMNLSYLNRETISYDKMRRCGLEEFIAIRQSHHLTRIIIDNDASFLTKWPNLMCLNCFSFGHYQWLCKQPPNPKKLEMFDTLHPGYLDRHKEKRVVSRLVRVNNKGYLISSLRRALMDWPGCFRLEMALKKDELVRVVLNANPEPMAGVAFGIRDDETTGYFDLKVTEQVYDRRILRLYGLNTVPTHDQLPISVLSSI